MGPDGEQSVGDGDEQSVVANTAEIREDEKDGGHDGQPREDGEAGKADVALQAKDEVKDAEVEQVEAEELSELGLHAGEVGEWDVERADLVKDRVTGVRGDEEEAGERHEEDAFEDAAEDHGGGSGAVGEEGKRRIR